MSKHYAIVGRVCGDDEDMVYTYADCTQDDAVRQFISDIVAPGDNPDDVFVNQILVSDSPIYSV